MKERVASYRVRRQPKFAQVRRVSVPIEDAPFRPRGIAVIGASSDPEKRSGRPLGYLRRLGYRGAIYPVNPARPQVQGMPAYRRLADIDGPVDLAVVVVPSTAVPQALHDCAAAGVAAAIVFASGFGEMSGAGDALAAEIAAIVRDTALRVVGPNCLGTFGLPARAVGMHTAPPAAPSTSGRPPIRAALAAHLPPFGSTANPIDMTGALITDPALLGRRLAEIAPAPEIDMLLVILGNADRAAGALVECLAAGYAATSKPFIISWSGGSGRPRQALLDRGFPTFSDPLRAVRALAHLARFR